MDNPRDDAAAMRALEASLKESAQNSIKSFARDMTEFDERPHPSDAQDVNDPGYKPPVEVPKWGEEAAGIILGMAEERAKHIEKFGDSIVNRAQEWQRLANDLAKSIRMTAEKEVEAIRRETAKMLKAGNRIEVALREFSPPDQEMSNGRDRRAGEKASVDTSDSALGDAQHRAKEAIATAQARRGAIGAGKGAVIPSTEFKPRGFA
jgi:hypothetical protein